jgi:Cytochrome c oxidase subunit IV
MSPDGRPEEPTELVYLPRGSWAPAFLAAGIALLVLGAFLGWFLLLVGALVTLLALIGWGGRVARDFLRLPRRQRVRPAVLPPMTFRHPVDRD